MNKILSNRKVIAVLIIPGVVLFVFAVVSPIILSFYYGMTDYEGIGKINLIGFNNYIEIILHDKVFYIGLWHSLILAMGYILLQHPLMIMFAILLDKVEGKLEKFFRALFFIPCVISIVVTSKMWINIYEPTFGLLNKVLGSIGLDFLKSEWLGGKGELALLSILIILIWQGFGWGLMVYYAGVKGIPGDLYEAALIDGANKFNVHTKITVPLLKPVIRINVTLAIIAAFKQMETVYLTTNGGPSDKTQFLANYLYIKAFNASQYGYANAISVLFVLVCIVVTIMVNKILKTTVD